MSPLDVGVLITAGLAAGLLAGMFGVGGGVLMVPVMVLLLGFSQHLAAGTSLIVIIPIAVVGAAAHLRHHLVDLRAAALLATGGVVGAVLGGTIALGLDGTNLRRLFVAYLVVVGIRLLGPADIRALVWRLGGPRASTDG